MNLLRANVTTRGGWWEVTLIDLDIMADGDSEAEMLRQLEYAISAEYHLALKRNEPPFVRLLKNVPRQVAEHWQGDDKKLRQLNIPQEVRQALSIALHTQTMNPFRLSEETAAA